MVLKQLEDGEQTKVVQSAANGYERVYALGQFINDLARKQRGIHGSSAGLRVIAETNKNGQIAGLILYLQHRKHIESLVPPENRISGEKVERDEKNVIKISETLYSLSFVKSGQSPTEELKTSLLEKLESSILSKNEGRGWNYYTDNKEVPYILPTAYAYLALKKNGIVKDEIRKELIDRLEAEAIETPTQFAIHCYVLFSVVIGDFENYSNEETKRIKAILKRILKSNYCVLDNDYEQNIEYWGNSEHDYVRVPWQLFLISTISIVSQNIFYTKKVQKRISKIVNDAKSKGFLYPHSGPYVSTRTNGLLYDNLSLISENLEKRYYIIYYWMDNVKHFLNKRFVRIALSFIWIVLFVYSGYIILENVNSKNKEVVQAIGINLVSTVIYACFFAILTNFSKRK